MTSIYLISFDNNFKLINSKLFIIDIIIQLPDNINYKGIMLNGNNMDLINLFELIESNDLLRSDLEFFFEENKKYYQSFAINNTIIIPNIQENIDKKLKYPKNILIYLDNCVKLFNETFMDKDPFILLLQINNWREIIVNEYIDELNNNFNNIIIKKDSDKLSIMLSNFTHTEKLIKLSKISDETYTEISILFQEIKNLCNNI